MTIVFMKIERISENRLKITVPMSYFIEKNISFDNFDSSSKQAQEFFCELMEKIEEEYGLGFLSSHLVIETVPSDSDDVVFMLTKSGNDSPVMPILERYLSRKMMKNPMLSQRGEANITKSKNSNIYVFKEFEDLCKFSLLVSDMYKGFNSVYKLNDMFYLVLDKKCIDEIDEKTEFSYLSKEYSNEIKNSAFYEGYLNEYGKLLVLGNAVDVLKEYFA